MRAAACPAPAFPSLGARGRFAHRPLIAVPAARRLAPPAHRQGRGGEEGWGRGGRRRQGKDAGPGLGRGCGRDGHRPAGQRSPRAGAHTYQGSTSPWPPSLRRTGTSGVGAERAVRAGGHLGASSIHRGESSRPESGRPEFVRTRPSEREAAVFFGGDPRISSLNRRVNPRGPRAGSAWAQPAGTLLLDGRFGARRRPPKRCAPGGGAGGRRRGGSPRPPGSGLSPGAQPGPAERPGLPPPLRPRARRTCWPWPRRG